MGIKIFYNVKILLRCRLFSYLIEVKMKFYDARILMPLPCNRFLFFAFSKIISTFALCNLCREGWDKYPFRHKFSKYNVRNDSVKQYLQHSCFGAEKYIKYNSKIIDCLNI